MIPTLITLDLLCGKPQGSALLADPHLKPYVLSAQQQLSTKKDDPSRYHLCNATHEAMQELIRAHVPILAGTDTRLRRAGSWEWWLTVQPFTLN
ncbi:MAG TPA: hypothetical protein VKV15_25730 [Bryobacteraceae bacterium]|nr:hypothetical protein [Bryobacteraceae bacterium]